MAARPDPLPYERRLARLDAVYRAAQDEISSLIADALVLGDRARAGRLRQQLTAVVQVLEQLGATVTPLARELVADAYQQSATVTGRQVAGVLRVSPTTPATFTSVSRESIAQLQASLLDRLDAAHQTVGRRVEDVFAREQRHAAVRQMLGANGSSQLSAASLQRELQQQGVTAFVDRSGRAWHLEHYSRMATRTVTREAVTQGAIDRMASHGISLARVSTHGSRCAVCGPMEGRLISLDGETAEVGGEAVLGADRVPPFHPNCKHVLSPYVAGIEALKAEMAAADRSTLDRLAAAGVAGA